MEQMQPTVNLPAGAPTGVVSSLIGEDEEQWRRAARALAAAIVLHVIAFLLNFSFLASDFLIEETETPDRLIEVNLQLPSTPDMGGGSNRPITAPPEPVKIRLPFKSEIVPTRVPVPDLPEQVTEEVELPSLQADLTSVLNTGPVLAPPGTGGTGGFDGSGRGGVPGAGERGGIGTAGRGGYGRPQILNKPKPEWTEEARRNGIQGEVLLKAIFAADGTVRNIQIVRGLGYGLDEKAIEAAKLIRFIPARGPDGRPASVRATISVEFTLL